jgi:ribosome-associated protein
MDELDDDAPLPPSKSSRKRAALGMQKLGQHLVGMREQERAPLPLSDTLREAIAEARRLTQRGALARQFQYIGKLMRDEDVPAIEAALDAQIEAHKARARLRK